MTIKYPPAPYIESLYGGRALDPSLSKYLIVHSLEAPAKPGIARSLANGWWRNPSNKTSVHNVNCPKETIATRSLDKIAWGCGTGNNRGTQYEFVGYASWSSAQWRNAEVLKALKHGAKAMAWDWHELHMKKRGIKYYPDWLKLTEIAKGEKHGLITHNDSRLVFGGTTHTDPGPHFPYAELKAYIWEELDKLTGAKKKTAAPKVDAKGTYTVRKGDTLSGIAAALLGNARRFPEIAKLNGLSNADLIRTGQVLKIPGKAAPAKTKYTPPPKTAFPFARNSYIGLITGPARSHGGYYKEERKYITWVQTRLNELGYPVPVTGEFRSQTFNAVSAWQKDRHAATTSFYGQVWWDDWANLIKDR